MGDRVKPFCSLGCRRWLAALQRCAVVTLHPLLSKRGHLFFAFEKIPHTQSCHIFKAPQHNVCTVPPSKRETSPLTRFLSMPAAAINGYLPCNEFILVFCLWLRFFQSRQFKKLTSMFSVQNVNPIKLLQKKGQSSTHKAQKAPSADFNYDLQCDLRNCAVGRSRFWTWRRWPFGTPSVEPLSSVCQDLRFISFSETFSSGNQSFFFLMRQMKWFSLLSTAETSISFGNCWR